MKKQMDIVHDVKKKHNKLKHRVKKGEKSENRMGERKVTRGKARK